LEDGVVFLFSLTTLALLLDFSEGLLLLEKEGAIASSFSFFVATDELVILLVVTCANSVSFGRREIRCSLLIFVARVSPSCHSSSSSSINRIR